MVIMTFVKFSHLLPKPVLMVEDATGTRYVNRRVINPNFILYSPSSVRDGDADMFARYFDRGLKRTRASSAYMIGFLLS